MVTTRKYFTKVLFLVEELRSGSNEVGLEIHLSKTKVMFNRYVEKQSIRTKNVTLDQVNK